MSANENHNALLTGDLYHKSYSDLNQLHTQLPQEAVTSLAREVLERLANKLNDPNSDAQSVLALCEALIDPDPKAAAGLIEQHHRDGADIDALYLDYLAPAAARLGEWWESDEVTFADVSIGTGRIYAIMRTLGRRIRPKQIPDNKTAFFAAVPGEDHSLGVRMASDLARKEGWIIAQAIDLDHDTLINQITQSGHLLIGLSAGGEHALPNLARLVIALRVSMPDALILISGNIADAAAEQIRLLNVDAMASTFEGAMAELDRLWSELQPNSEQQQ